MSRSLSLGHEANAALAIAARDVVRWLHDPAQLFFSAFFPIIFIGLMGTSIDQNLGGGLPYNYMQFVLLGMTATTLYMSGLQGMSSLIEERETGFAQEIFVAPVSRYTIVIGKIVGSSVTALFSLVSVFAVAVVLRIPLGWAEVGRILVIAPALALSGAALGVFFISLVGSPAAADRGSFLLVFPQVFLSGAIIPVNHASGFLSVVAHLLPMTYLIDLLRGVFYLDTTTYSHVVLHTTFVDAAVSIGYGVVFVVLGTVLFAHSERNR